MMTAMISATRIKPPPTPPTTPKQSAENKIKLLFYGLAVQFRKIEIANAQKRLKAQDSKVLS